MLKLFCRSLIIFACTSNSICTPPRRKTPNIIIYTTPSGSRYGDCLLAYMHAKWVSFLLKAPIIYKPFQYSDRLILCDTESLSRNIKMPTRRYNIINEQTLRNSPPSNHLLVVPYFPESKAELAQGNWTYFKVDWTNKDFKARLKECIRPKSNLNELQIPTNKLTLAVHVRKGGGIDGKEAFAAFPCKFPSDEWYLEQIKNVSSFFENRPIYVHIFTDDLNPMQILDRYQKSLNNQNLEFCTRTTANNPTNNVLEDFFALTKFDILICPDSNFSITASKIADYLLVVSPAHYKQQGSDKIIDLIDVSINNTVIENLDTSTWQQQVGTYKGPQLGTKG